METSNHITKVAIVGVSQDASNHGYCIKHKTISDVSAP